MKKSGSREAQLYKHSHLVIHYSIIFLSLRWVNGKRCAWGFMPPFVKLHVPIASRLQDHKASVPRSPGPLHTSQVRDLSPCSLTPSVSVCSHKEALCSCSEKRSNSLGSLCPGGRDHECVAIIRDDCWEAGCHGTAEARAAHAQDVPVF